MKRRLVLAGVLLPLLWPSPVQAHTLRVRDAKALAVRHARYLTTLYAQDGRPEYFVGGCRSRSRHTVDCSALFRFSSGQVCGQTIRVRFISARRLSAGTPFAPRCRD